MTRLSERGAVWSAWAVWAGAAILVVANAALIVVAFPDLHPGDRFYSSLGDVGGSYRVDGAPGCSRFAPRQDDTQATGGHQMTLDDTNSPISCSAGATFGSGARKGVGV